MNSISVLIMTKIFNFKHLYLLKHVYLWIISSRFISNAKKYIGTFDLNILQNEFIASFKILISVLFTVFYFIFKFKRKNKLVSYNYYTINILVLY